MGFRFRKSKKVGPFRINMSQKGIGWSVGVKGLRYTKKAGGGSRVTASIPGAGISYVTDSKKPSRQSQPEITAPDQKLLDQASPAAGRNYDPSPAPGGTGSGGGKRPGHGCLWWVVAILFWPFSLSIWFWRSSLVSNKALKAGILAVAWVLIVLAGGNSTDTTSPSLPVASSGPASSMIAASSEAEEEEDLPAESTPASEPASSQEVQEDADSVPASSQELQETAAASEPAVPASSQDSPAASSEAAAPAPVETEPAPAVTAPAPAEPQQQEVMVWIPATGSKYHSRSDCSGMNNPRQVTLEYAQSHGYEPCKRCY